MVSEVSADPVAGMEVAHSLRCPAFAREPFAEAPVWLGPAELVAAVTDPETTVVLTDENGVVPARWCLGGAGTHVADAYAERSRCVLHGDRGYRTGPNHVVLTIGSNGSLPDELLIGATYCDLFDHTLHTISPFSLSAVRRGLFGDEHPLYWHLAACARWAATQNAGNEVRA